LSLREWCVRLVSSRYERYFLPQSRVPSLGEGRQRKSFAAFAALRQGFSLSPQQLASLRLGQIGQLREDPGIMDGNVGQHFAVNLHIGHFQAMYQLTVVEAIQPRRGIDAGNPQAAEIALAVTPIAKGVEERLEHGFVGPAIEPMLGAKLPFGEL